MKKYFKVNREDMNIVESIREQSMKGYYFYTPSKEYFFVTEQMRRTEKLCKAVEDYLIEDGCRRVYNGKYHGVCGDSSIKDKLKAGTCEVKHTENNGDYYNIKGEGWGGCGSFVHDGKTKIVLL